MVFLSLCLCGGVFVLVWWCFCAGVFVVVFLCWCFCGGVCVGVFVWLCSCGGVFVVVFSSWCGSVFVLVWWCSCGGVFVVVFLWWCTKSYSVLQRTTPVLRQYYKSFQNEHFVRGFRNFSQKKLPKSSFRARLPPNFTEQASKTSVSRDASNNFHRKSFQNHRFVRGFFQISQNKLPKRAFRAMLPTIFTEKASKMIVSCEASSKFHRTKLPKRRFARCFHQFSTKICVSPSFARSTHRILREGSSCKIKMCVSLQRRAIQNFKMCVSPQPRAQKCMSPSTVNRPASRTQKCDVLLQFWTIDTTFLPRGLTDRK